MSPVYDHDAASAAILAIQARHREVCAAGRILLDEVGEIARNAPGLVVTEVADRTGWIFTLSPDYEPRPVSPSEAIPAFRFTLVGTQVVFSEERPPHTGNGMMLSAYNRQPVTPVHLRYDPRRQRFVNDNSVGLIDLGTSFGFQQRRNEEDAVVAILRMVVQTLFNMPTEQQAPLPQYESDLGADFFEDCVQEPVQETEDALNPTVWERLKQRLNWIL